MSVCTCRCSCCGVGSVCTLFLHCYYLIETSDQESTSENLEEEELLFTEG